MFSAKHLFRSAASAAVVCTLLSALPAMAALDGYIKVTGSKQGQVKTSPILELRTSRGAIVESKSQAKGDLGKRSHKPITVVKESNDTDKFYMDAVAHNEPINEVNVDINGKGKEPTKLKLTGASISKIEHTKINGKEYLEIEFTYREIQWTYSTGKTSVQDDWTATN